MIYHLHECNEPIDPRHRTFDSLDTFRGAAPSVVRWCDQIDMAEAIFERWPDAICMPVAVRLGSGNPVMIGVLPSIYAPRDTVIPFIAFVRAEAEIRPDELQLKRGTHFDRRTFRTPVMHPPSGSAIVKSELRASDMETPLPGEATVWKDGDKFVVHLEVGGGEMSIALERERVADVTRPTEKPLTETDLSKLVSAIVTTNGEARVQACSDYVRTVLERETDPIDKIARFMIGLLSGMDEVRRAQREEIGRDDTVH